MAGAARRHSLASGGEARGGMQRRDCGRLPRRVVGHPTQREGVRKAAAIMPYCRCSRMSGTASRDTFDHPARPRLREPAGMPYSYYRPDLMGSAALTPSGSFEAGSLQSFALVYTAGTFGVDDTGSIKIGFRFATDFGPVQFTDPKAQGYTTVAASNGAVLEAKWEFKRNIRPWSRSLYIGVVKDCLAPGDTITVRLGDRRFGSPGIRLQTYCESAFEFRVFADPIATYDYVALPESPQIAIVPGPGARWHAVLPTLVRAGEPFRLSIKADDKW